MGISREVTGMEMAGDAVCMAVLALLLVRMGKSTQSILWFFLNLLITTNLHGSKHSTWSELNLHKLCEKDLQQPKTWLHVWLAHFFPAMPARSAETRRKLVTELPKLDLKKARFMLLGHTKSEFLILVEVRLDQNNKSELRSGVSPRVKSSKFSQHH